MKPGMGNWARKKALLAVAVWIFGASFCAIPTFAQDADFDALALADKPPTTTAKASDWKVYAEAALGGNIQRADDTFQRSERASFDLQYDKSLGSGWRMLFANRLDLNWPAQSLSGQHAINTIKEAYVSWQASPDTIIDVGRINVRNGVATGYNPTDYFRTGAVRSAVSVDPGSLKENRQGSLMLRGQYLWENSALTAMFSPKLSDRINTGSFATDIGATNDQDRWLLGYSFKINEKFNPQVLLFKDQHSAAQLGFNLASLVSDSTVAFFEWSGGRQVSSLTQSLSANSIPHDQDNKFRQNLASGLSYTSSNKLTVTAELEYHGAGLDQTSWDALIHHPLPYYGVYRNWLQTVQDTPSQRAVFLYASWQDAMINHLDLSAMERYNADDYSRLSWLEARYHLEHVEFAMQWQRNSGKALSEYGAAAQIQALQFIVRQYF